ncbi:DUF3131 domain-containing protein [Rubellimicrobium roseum]|uniref:DUF3131 domain-containing protein n=1 Tax=Rubellimicrobium roseum TaxID=687525 RepID=A0A5C4NDE0_9RHOB|nr:DUF3131 domain-containing protein [Rubellimicrobium roseum]TNC66584.1 DUF3131 domain-containing protein [Rubellimicrobium roseum]
MTTRNGWRSARGHIVFLLALVTAFAIVYALEQWETGEDAAASAWVADPEALAPPPPYAALSAGQREDARAAWAYFLGNTQPDTGLVNTIAGYPATTMWDTGGFLLAAIAAERLSLLPRDEFDRRVGQALDSLARLPLYDGKLPNKSYDTRTLAMTDYANEPTETGIGWSALDIGRLLVPLHVLLTRYPGQAEGVQAVLAHWDLGAAVQDGRMVGALPLEDGEGHELVQEGRLGYEQYAARGFELFGFDMGEADRVEAQLDWAEVHGVEVPVDRRDPEAFGAHSHTLSEPYLLAALEYGWDTRLRDLAWRVYRAQERRFEDTGTLTAVTEDHLDRAPFFVFSSVVANGEPWAVLTDTGENVEAYRILSTKAALGWHALYRTGYTERLAGAVQDLRTPDGWQAGRYESLDEPDAALAANTNAVVLTALHYWAMGPMLHPRTGRRTDEAAATP